MKVTEGLKMTNLKSNLENHDDRKSYHVLYSGGQLV